MLIAMYEDCYKGWPIKNLCNLREVKHFCKYTNNPDVKGIMRSHASVLFQIRVAVVVHVREVRYWDNS